ncbi:hypothetical protein JTB14_025767 [Gonioctena quinquepunctata]|nr:hypothetical protein JTB14_025767 [Gonioctena quinquepunctata]
MWCLNASSGYLVNFDIYQGDNPKSNENYEREFGEFAAPLMSMIDTFPKEMEHLSHKFYFDNLLTSFNILYFLKQRGYDATGTMRENRIPKTCPLQQNKQLIKSTKRDEFDTTIDKEDGVILVKWIDNNVVIAGSTCNGINPVLMVRIYFRTDKKIVPVVRPSIISH